MNSRASGWIVMALSAFLLGSPGVARAAIQPDGSIIRTESDPKVYYIENDTKRWIDSEATFRNQGFHWSDVRLVTASELGLLRDGEALTVNSNILLPGEASVLPDLIPFPARDLRLVKEGGRMVLRFTAAFVNAGKAPLEILAYPSRETNTVDGYLDTYQHIVRADGKFRDRIVGHFMFHNEHHHYHFSDFVDYTLELVKPTSATAPTGATAVTQKTSFCMRDDEAIIPGANGVMRPRRYYGVCGPFNQGVTAGWADVYKSDLPDQLLDVQDLQPGLYRLSFNIDPTDRFAESNYTNDISVTYIELDPAKNIMNVVAAGSAFPSTRNFFPDGMLLRGSRDNGVYVISHNRRRLLITPTIFESYGYRWDNVETIPQSVLDAIPRVSLVRVNGTTAIYLLNENGFRRRIVNPTVFASYKSDLTDIGQVEFNGYRDTGLIRLATSNDVYLVGGGTKRKVATVETMKTLGYEPEALQIVNTTDFNAYATIGAEAPAPTTATVTVVAEGLNVPWDIAFLPGGDMLVTERTGTVRRIGSHAATITIPSVQHVGEGGLMGIALHPQFEQNQLLYLYFTTDAGYNRIVRFRLDGDALTADKTIIDGIASSLYHDGGQIAFGPDGMLYVTTGDAEHSDWAQNTANLSGKTLRLTPEGAIPAGNPFGTAVWSYGHRNAQGLAWDGQGRLWETEHGRSGALSGLDELNRVEQGKNYGWPTIQGNTTKAGMITPVINSGEADTWAPSGIAYVNGKLFWAGLRGSALYSATVNADGSVSGFKKSLAGTYGRLRGVVLGPDGYLYVTTSNRDGRGTVRAGDDKVLKVRPDAL